MNDDDWEELETKMCGAIRLNLADDIAYPFTSNKVTSGVVGKIGELLHDKIFN